MQIQCHAINELLNAKSRTYQREVERKQRLERRSEFTASYVGTDANTGLTTVRCTDGGIITGRLITNAGLTEGDSVIVQRTWGNPYATIKAMPR